MALLKKALSDSVAVNVSGVWFTHLNDLRAMSLGLSSDKYERFLLTELKTALLFYGRHLIVPDADLTDNPVFQGLFMRNHQGIRTVFQKQRVIVALRDEAQHLSSVNEKKGDHRADPSMLERCRPFALEFDRYFDTHSIETVEWSLRPLAQTFSDSVALLCGRDSPLAPDEKNTLKAISETARKSDEKGRLLFGRLYPCLTSQPDRERLVAAVRTAYAFAPSLAFHVPPLAAHEDDQANVAHFLLTGRSASEPSLEDISDTLGFFPKKILTDEGLEAMTFDEIVSATEAAHDVCYYESLERARQSFVAQKGDSWKQPYIEFLKALRQYQEKLVSFPGFEFYEWQESVLRELLDKIDAKRDYRAACWWAVPVVVVATTGTLLGLNLLPGSWETLVGGICSLATARSVAKGGEHFEKVRANRLRAEIQALLRRSDTRHASRP